jgi:hypothetical protein
MKDEKLLEIYLDDHWAGAGAGNALARRVERHNRGTEWGPILTEVANQIAEDEQTLRELRSRLGFDGGGAKRLLAMAGERVARLKLNGRLVGFSPLSRLIEIETDTELETLEQRAAEQLEVLASAHERAASDLVVDLLARVR